MNSTKVAGEIPSPAQVAVALRERIYGSIACLSSLIVLQHDDHATAWSSILSVAVAAGGLWGAALLAEFVSHTSVHEKVPSLAEIRHMFVATGQILQAVVTPILVLALSAAGLFSLHRALRIDVILLIVTLGVFGFIAVMRTKLPWWVKVLVIVAEMGLGIAVVILKTLAH